MVDLSSFVVELKHRVNIVQVIANYVTLKKVGGRYVGLCPFHGDRNPSMTVSIQMGIFKCFSCGQGGDVINFLQEYEKIDFISAIRQLSDIVGLTMPSFKAKISISTDHRKLLLEIYAQTAICYSNQLKGHSRAQLYLEKREISLEIIQKFGLGFSSVGWSDLIEYFKTKNYKPEQIVSVGLAKNNEHGFRDTFVNRLMFPIYNLSHQVVGFGGRILDPEKKTAKYINSAESILYDKSSILYGLNLSRKAIQISNEVIVVEGYMDVLRLFQIGIENVVAISGTSLTQEQSQILSRFASVVYLFFDGDKAGVSAMEKSLPVLLKQRLEIRLPRLPEKEDPDSFILKHGYDVVKKTLKNSDNILGFLLRDFKKEPSTYTNEQRGGLFEKIKRIFDLIQSSFVRNEYLRDLDKIEKEYSIKMTGFLLESNSHFVKSNSVTNLQSSLGVLSKRVQHSSEWKILPYLIFSDEILEQFFDEKFFDSRWIQDSFLQELVERIMVECEKMERIELKSALDSLPKKFKDIICMVEPLDFKKNQDIGVVKKSLMQMFHHLRIMFLRREVEKLDQQKLRKEISSENWKRERFDIQRQLKVLMGQK